MAKLKLTLIKGFGGKSDNQIDCVKALGLTRQGRSAIVTDSPNVQGLLRRVRHMVAIESVKEG